MTTNGSTLARHAKALAGAGLGRITVSLDAVDDARFRHAADVDFPVARVLEALGASGLQRIQELVSLANVELPAAGLLDAARCLAAAGDADSREALQALARRGPRAIRGHVRALLGTP
jgi:hypothetical protein